jgi:hypothetical protein
VFAPILSISNANEGLCFHQSQIFCWITSGHASPLVWMEMD